MMKISLGSEIQMNHTSVPHRENVVHTKMEKSSVYFFLKKIVKFTNM